MWMQDSCHIDILLKKTHHKMISFFLKTQMWIIHLIFIGIGRAMQMKCQALEIKYETWIKNWKEQGKV